MSATVKVFDPALCCSTGVCGPTTDAALPRIAADLDWLRQQGVAVARFNLAQEPAAFVAEAQVRRALEQGGVESLPLVLVDGRVVAQGHYPDRASLAAAAGLTAATAGDVDAVPPACCESTEAACCEPTGAACCEPTDAACCAEPPAATSSACCAPIPAAAADPACCAPVPRSAKPRVSKGGCC